MSLVGTNLMRQHFHTAELYHLYHLIVSTDEVTRDYTYGETDPLVRQCRLLPWIPTDLEGVSSATTEPPDSFYEVKTIDVIQDLYIVIIQRNCVCIYLYTDTFFHFNPFQSFSIN